MKILNIDTTSKLAFHLSKLNGFIAKRKEYYILTTHGFKLLNIINEIEDRNLKNNITTKSYNPAKRVSTMFRLMLVIPWIISLSLYMFKIMDLFQSIFIGYSLMMIIAGKDFPLLIRPSLLYHHFNLRTMKINLFILLIAITTFVPLVYIWNNTILSYLAISALVICSLNFGGILVFYSITIESKIESFVEVNSSDILRKEVKPGTNISFKGRVERVRNATHIEAMVSLLPSPSPKLYEIDNLKVITPEYLPIPNYNVGDHVEVIGKLIEINGEIFVVSRFMRKCENNE